MEEEKAVEPGSKMCSSVQDPALASVRPCAHAPVTCVPSMHWPCGPTCAAVTGIPAGLPCTLGFGRRTGTIWCHPCTEAENKVSHLACGPTL
jgi:hypothetical protein